MQLSLPDELVRRWARRQCRCHARVERRGGNTGRDRLRVSGGRGEAVFAVGRDTRMVVVTATRKRRHSTGPVPSARCVGRAHAPPSWINERSRGREESATASENLGGTGFVVGVPMEGLDGVVYAYVITTRHALGHSAFPAIRLNQLSGTWDVLETDRSTWLEHPSGDDVAACSVGIRTEHQVISVPVDFFVTEEMTEAGWF